MKLPSVVRWSALAALVLFGVRAVFGVTDVLLIAGPPSHGPGEHRFPDGCALLADALNKSGLPLHAEVSQGWPSDEALGRAHAVILYSDGLDQHPAIGHEAALRGLITANKGIGIIHFALEPLRGPLGEIVSEAVGGVFDPDWSVNPVWKLQQVTLATHPATRGLKTIETEDEWYYHLRFREGVVPLLQAVPPAKSLGQDGPRTGNPTLRDEVARGVPQTLAWAYAPTGRRAFGFTGGHFHRNWGDTPFRQLVLNAIVWTAGVEVPAEGVPSEVAPLPKYATIDEAIARGDLDDVKLHLKIDPSRAQRKSETAMAPLHQAILRNRTEIAQALIEAGAEVNVPDRSRRTPLHLCVERGNVAAAKLLLARKAKPNERDQIGWTPLHHAAAKNNVAIARVLLDGGADPMTLSERGGTPLHEAAASGGAEMVQLLLDHHVDPKIVSKMGVTALDIAREYKNEPAVALLVPVTK